ncbi:ABC transporter ATP-binding protein [Micromonospora sp. WMMD975]|uniref:ABC transporter ATP-binding protein n=1 Tax=Micromonospora sp. WMMD975 TaxID=3016087 RepID=UPI002499EF2F|nr:ABC transporter ATP-binding protein [Micromonospora sp. WMMD975]WFE34613.1 ABC transporter ATP-binding protein [Micromonospora sp. WMMD975]
MASTDTATGTPGTPDTAPAETDGDRTVCELDDLSRVYFGKSGQPVVAIGGMSFQIKEGEVLSVIGPSGCGKSSLLRILAGLDRDYEGTLRWQRQVNDSGRHRLASATVFQSDSLFPWLTVRRNVELPLKPLGCGAAERRERSQRYLELTGLRDFVDAYPHELSGGMRQRAALARALAAEPLLLLLDEPFAALDAQTRLIMQQELLNVFAKSPTTVLYVTHDIEEAVTLGDRVMVMTARPGRIRHLQEIDVPRHDEVMSTRSTEEFRTVTEQLWTILAEEVGDTLTTQRR